jgi:drug/metabolite transporter (DMT)-like permease
VVPTITSAAATVAVGVVPAALANWLWDCGFRQGNSQQLTVLSYTTPLFSALILVVLGLETLTSRLLVGAVLILLAALLSHTNASKLSPERRFERKNTQRS